MAASDFVGPPMASTGVSPTSLTNAGYTLAIAGALTGAIGTFFQVKTEQYRAKSAALSQEFEASMAALDARAAERDAQSVLEAGQSAVAQVSLESGAERAARRASFAGRGIDLNSANVLETQVSGDVLAAIDRYHISANAVRQANASRTRALNDRNRGLFAGTSARNLRASAKAASPFAAASTSLLTGFGNFGLQLALAGEKGR